MTQPAKQYVILVMYTYWVLFEVVDREYAELKLKWLQCSIFAISHPFAPMLHTICRVESIVL